MMLDLQQQQKQADLQKTFLRHTILGLENGIWL